MKRFIACAFAAVIIAGCGQEDVELPTGIQTVRGYLQPISFSLKRRGTHALLTASGGSLIAYAESTAVNLRSLQGRDVELQGTLEKNTDPADSPVLVVTAVVSGGDEDIRAWTIPALNVTLSVPKSWKASIKGGSASFTATGFTKPVLTITSRQSAVPASPQPTYGPPPLGSDILVVGLRKATAETDAADSTWIVHVMSPQPGGTETVFTFALKAGVSVDTQTILYRNILKTVGFKAAPVSSASSSSKAATTSSRPAMSVSSGQSASRAGGEGSACGGAAGILCPKGLFCKITDAANDSGVCVTR